MPAAAPSSLPVSGLLDFTDRWPAMVVKELRQGLRARGFVAPFLVLHAMVLVAVSIEYLITRTANSNVALQWLAGGDPGLFWIAVYAIVAGVMPLRLMDSILGENEGRNTELLLLGGLSRWKIVRGKWLVQSVLCTLSLVSLLPYMLVRYFFGGVELVPNLFSFLSVLFASFSMAGVVLGASGYAGLGMRFFVITGSGFFLFIAGISTEALIAFLGRAARITELAIFAYGYSYALLFHILYCLIGLQLGRGHLKLFLLPHQSSPTRGMLVMMVSSPFMLVAGALATCGWGAIVVLGLFVYAVSVVDRSPKPTAGGPVEYWF